MRLSIISALNRFFIFAFLVCALCVMAHEAVADNISLPEGKWTGVYTYFQDDVRTPVEFSAELFVEGDSFTGKFIERNTLGRKSTDWLSSTVIGRVNGNDMTFLFMKKYNGQGGVSHAVFYKGEIDPQTFRVRGKWEINGLSGAFYMAPQVY